MAMPDGIYRCPGNGPKGTGRLRSPSALGHVTTPRGASAPAPRTAQAPADAPLHGDRGKCRERPRRPGTAPRRARRARRAARAGLGGRHDPPDGAQPSAGPHGPPGTGRPHGRDGFRTRRRDDGRRATAGRLRPGHHARGQGCTERTDRPEAGGAGMTTSATGGRITARTYGKVVRREIAGFTPTHPSLFSQLRPRGEPLPKWPANPLATREERTTTVLRTLRGRAMHARPTSPPGPRVERFVIECFAPSCLVDIAADGELVTPTPRNTVDSIMSIEGWGPVQNRGESCRSERPDKNGETRTPRGA